MKKLTNFKIGSIFKIKQSIVAKISLGIIIPIVICSLLFSYLSYTNSMKLINNELIPSFENVLQTRIETLRAQISPEIVNKAKTDRTIQQQLLNTFNKFQQDKNVELVYIMSKINGKDVILALSGAEDYLTEYGFTDEQNRALQQSGILFSEIYEDPYGVHKSVFLRLEGTDSILGIDMSAAFIKDSQKVVVRNSIILSAIFIVLGTLVGIVLTRTLTRPLRNLVHHMGLVAQGDLTQHLETKSKDEVGQLIGHFNHMSEQLKQMIQQVRATSNYVVGSSESLAQSTEHTTKLINEMTVSIQQVAAGNEMMSTMSGENAKAMEEMSSGIQHIMELAIDVSSKSRNTSDAARQGNESIIKAVQQMESIQSSVSNSTTLVGQTNDRVLQISSIIDLIVEISSQINLLSLNAAIEAARAGEAGRGFAIVAQEVRKLADQSAQSAGEITAKIKAIQEESTLSFNAMKTVLNEVNFGATFVKEAGNSFSSILHAIDNVTEKIEAVSSVTEQFAASTEEMTATVEETARITQRTTDTTKTMSEASEEYSAEVEETAQQAEQLKKQASLLQQVVEKFKV